MGTLSKKLCAKFGHACVHLVWLGGWVCSISQLSSWPPYAELGAQAGSICRVNAQPQPQAAGPYKPHYSSRNHAGTHNHTSWTHIDMCSERRTHLIKPKVYHTMAKSPGLGKASEIHNGCLNWCEMNVAYMNSLYSMVKKATGRDTHQ